MLLSASGRVKLIDFGSAQWFSAPHQQEAACHAAARTGAEVEQAYGPDAGSPVSKDSQRQHIGGLAHTERPASSASPSDAQKRTLGTPAFMAPEVAAGGWFQGFAADCWAVGVCLFLAVTGQLPFRASSVHHLYNAIR